MKRIVALILSFCLCGTLYACGGQSAVTEPTPTEPTKETIILTPENVQDYLLIEDEAANYEKHYSGIGMWSPSSVDCVIQISKKTPCELSNVKLTLQVFPSGWFLDEEEYQTCEIQLPVDGNKTAELHFSSFLGLSVPEKFVIEVIDVSGSVVIEK